MMKNLIYLTMLLLLFMGCSKDNSNEEEAIIGKWQIIESCYNVGDGTWGCTDIENGKTVRFNEDGTFNYRWFGDEAWPGMAANKSRVYDYWRISKDGWEELKEADQEELDAF